MRVHPAPRKRNVTFRYEDNPSISATAESVVGQLKKLRRLPHVFTKILELPLASDADVTVQEEPEGFRFFAAAGGIGSGVEARAVEIHPGVMKVVVRDGDGDADEELEFDRWRIRLPPCTMPALATAAYVDGELVVFVPKGAGAEEDGGEDGVGGGEVFGGGGGGNFSGSVGIGRLVVVC